MDELLAAAEIFGNARRNAEVVEESEEDDDS